MKINLFLIQLSLLISSTLSERKLIFVYQHFRHGSRETDRTDSNGVDKFGFKWPISMGELTSVGMRQHYLIGVRNRDRYIDKLKLLSPVYDPREIKVTSNNYNRTLMSAYSQLQGMFPKSTGPTLTEGQIKHAFPNMTLTPAMKEAITKLQEKALPSQIQPVPAHEVIPLQHFFQLHNKDRCPGISEIQKNNYKNDRVSKAALEFYDKYADKLYEALDKGKGKKEKNKYKDFHYISSLAENYISDYQYGYKFQNLQEVGIDIKQLFDDFSSIYILDLEIGKFGDEDGKAAQIASSPLLSDLILFMRKKVDYDIRGEAEHVFDHFNRPKYLMVSGHDTTILGIQVFMKKYLSIEKIIPVTLAASIYFEVYKNEDAPEKGGTYYDYTVDYYFNDNKIKEWSFFEFNQQITDNIMKEKEISEICDFDRFDNGTDTKNKFVEASWTLGSLSVAIIVVSIIALIEIKIVSGKVFN